MLKERQSQGVPCLKTSWQELLPAMGNSCRIVSLKQQEMDGRNLEPL